MGIQNAISASNGSQSYWTVTFGNSNGMSFYTTNPDFYGFSVVGSYTVPSTAGLISAVNLSAGTTSNNLSAVTLSNSNGVSFGLNGSVVTGSHNGLTSQSNQAFSASGGSSAFQTLNFANSNGLTFSNNAGSVVASYTVPTQTNQTVGAYAVSNTTQSSSGTIDARSLSFQGAGAASVGVSNGSIIISAPNAGAGNVTFSAGTSSAGLASLVFSNSNGVSFGLNGSTITASADGGGGLASRYVYPDDQMNAISLMTNNSISIRYLPIYCGLTATRGELFCSFASTSSAATFTIGISYLLAGGIYTRTGATLNSLSTGSTNGSWTWISNSNNDSVPRAGLKVISFPINISATPGDYYMVVNLSTNVWGSSAAASGTRNSIVNSCTVFGGTAIGSVNAFNEFSLGSSITMNYLSGHGLLSVTRAVTDGLAASYALSDINQTGTNAQRADIAVQFRAV